MSNIKTQKYFQQKKVEICHISKHVHIFKKETLSTTKKVEIYKKKKHVNIFKKRNIIPKKKGGGEPGNDTETTS